MDSTSDRKRRRKQNMCHSKRGRGEETDGGQREGEKMGVVKGREREGRE